MGISASGRPCEQVDGGTIGDKSELQVLIDGVEPGRCRLYDRVDIRTWCHARHQQITFRTDAAEISVGDTVRGTD